MKATGIVRRVDGQGRIVIPKELRRINGIESGTPMEMFVSKEGIVLRVYKRECDFCGALKSEVPLTRFKGKLICDECKKELRDPSHAEAAVVIQ